MLNRIRCAGLTELLSVGNLFLLHFRAFLYLNLAEGLDEAAHRSPASSLGYKTNGLSPLGAL